MKLLLISDLNGNEQSYEFLISQAENFDAMLWVGSLTDPQSDNPAKQQSLVERAYGAVQARGCRVLACGGEKDGWGGPWHWLERQGMFITSGLFVTTIPGNGVSRAQLATLREAAWNAGAVWVVLTRGLLAPSMLTAGSPKGMLLWPNAALSFGPDVIVTSHSRPGSREREWCKRRGHSWVLTPGEAEEGGFPSYVVLDLRRWTATRYSRRTSEQRDMSALRRIPSAVKSRELLAA